MRLLLWSLLDFDAGEGASLKVNIDQEIEITDSFIMSWINIYLLKFYGMENDSPSIKGNKDAGTNMCEFNSRELSYYK